LLFGFENEFTTSKMMCLWREIEVGLPKSSAVESRCQVYREVLARCFGKLAPNHEITVFLISVYTLNKCPRQRKAAVGRRFFIVEDARRKLSNFKLMRYERRGILPYSSLRRRNNAYGTLYLYYPPMEISPFCLSRPRYYFWGSGGSTSFASVL
jgi:hypothetical protein